MSGNPAARVRSLVVASFALALSFLLIAAPHGVAKSSTGQSSGETIAVVGHIDLPGMHVKQMFLRDRDGKFYIYLQRPNKHAFAVVDVTNPAKPVLVERAALQQSAGGSVTLPPDGSVLAISVRPDAGSAGSAASAPATLPSESVRLIDLSDPKHPRTLKTFEGVTSMTTDDGRKLVYIVNNEGLWIVSHHHLRPLPVCSSDADDAALPSCE